ncbi:hypothetical protein TWF706_000876 [Orbilia oligospora]|uniref:Biogenesis of lysosome-related organelles complex 1 subunit 2 n=1 Tax=Orbilia oligospora TaxID=2813651 RepID=A0A7C8JRQ3_ORBOL|nr:hypothetical protein TWF706_000876 [Orbilia oligospora]KAF3128580.1 hypothetical protein TWF703_009330 [Orbilia oligospora]
MAPPTPFPLPGTTTTTTTTANNGATTQNHPTTAVQTVLSSLENLIEADSSAILGDLDLLHKINEAARERYKAMTEAAVGLETDSEYLRGRYAELKKYTKQVDDIDERVGDLEKLVKELDEWCSELEVKIKRLGNQKR